MYMYVHKCYVCIKQWIGSALLIWLNESKHTHANTVDHEY